MSEMPSVFAKVKDSRDAEEGNVSRKEPSDTVQEVTEREEREGQEAAMDCNARKRVRGGLAMSESERVR